MLTIEPVDMFIVYDKDGDVIDTVETEWEAEEYVREDGATVESVEMYGVYGDGGRIKLFEQEYEAEDWLAEFKEELRYTEMLRAERL